MESINIQRLNDKQEQELLAMKLEQQMKNLNDSLKVQAADIGLSQKREGELHE